MGGASHLNRIGRLKLYLKVERWQTGLTRAAPPPTESCDKSQHSIGGYFWRRVLPIQDEEDVREGAGARPFEYSFSEKTNPEPHDAAPGSFPLRKVRKGDYAFSAAW
jgi:hypothetical protein